MNIGAGTVCTMEELDLACDAGASFIVSPILSIEIIKKSIERKVAVFPGALTPTEIFKAHLLGATAVKVFPITSFGPKYVKDLIAPLDNMKLIPVGGVSKNNIRAFFENGSYGVGMASSLFSKNLISKNSMEKLSQHFKSILNEIQD
jgi:2-dehydro-3-deoxyphosphogluconate aldolase/(4S)-4-hydroxy-2-oxoglutarate aldolase